MRGSVNIESWCKVGLRKKAMCNPSIPLLYFYKTTNGQKAPINYAIYATYCWRYYVAVGMAYFIRFGAEIKIAWKHRRPILVLAN
jgi:hypothetical protein